MGVRIKFVTLVHWFKRRWIPRDVRKAVEMRRCITDDRQLPGKVCHSPSIYRVCPNRMCEMHRGRPSIVTRPREPKDLWISCEGHIRRWASCTHSNDLLLARVFNHHKRERHQGCQGRHGHDDLDVSRETQRGTEIFYPRYSPMNGCMSGESTLVIQFQNGTGQVQV